MSGSSSAWIVKNQILNNGENGVGVFQVSQGRISKNTINGNGTNSTACTIPGPIVICAGITVGQNSGVNLGRDMGSSIFDSPNSTTAGSENKDFGIRCFINSYADGRLGTLDGTVAAKSFNLGASPNGGCIDSLNP